MLVFIVYTLLLLDTVQSVFATSFAWGILVSGWGDPTVFAGFSWSGVTIPIMTGLGVLANVLSYLRVF